jgi:hypothetical protein
MDTTVQADKYLGSKDKRQYIISICKKNKLISSTYVLGEFKSSFLRDATALYTLVLDSYDIPEVLIRLEETFSKRIDDRMSKLLGNLIRELGLNKDELLDRLEYYIEDLLIKRFKQDLDSILLDDTKCLRSNAKPYKENSTWKIDTHCRQSQHPKCCIISFFEKNREDAVKIIDLPVHMEKIQKLLVKVLSKQVKPYGNNCRTLGDTIICLEAPKGSCIFSTNKKDFIPLCEKLKKTLI